MRKIFFLLTILLMLSISTAQEIEFLPSSIGEMEAQVKITGGGNVSGLKEGQTASMKVLTFKDSPYQEIDILKEHLTINDKVIPANHSYGEFNNRYAIFDIPENGDFSYELIVNVRTTSLLYSIKDYNLGKEPSTGEKYLQPSPKVESDSSEIRTLVKNNFNNKSFIKTLNHTVSWVNEYVEYARGSEFNKYYNLQQSALETLEDKKGVCDEFANLGTAILRAKGVPTRLAIGITFDGSKWGNHAWIEVRHPEIGWIPSDPTFREAGFVDATHIKMGSFSDVSLSRATTKFPAGATVNFDNPELPQVTLKETKPFNKVAVHAEAIKLESGKWNLFEVEVTNKANGTINVPITLRESFENIYIKDERKDALLGPGKTKKIGFEIYPHMENVEGWGPESFAEPNNSGLMLNSLSTPLQIDFQINYSEGEDNGTVEVLDIIPLVSGDMLEIESTISNYTPESVEIEMQIINTDENVSREEELEPFSFKKRFKESLPLDDGIYTVEINTPTAKYTKKINPAEKKESEMTVEETFGGEKVSQSVEMPPPANAELRPSGLITIATLVFLLIFFIIITTYYISKKKRYI